MAEKITKKLLDKKEVAHLSRDIEDKCTPIGFVNLHNLYPHARYGTDIAIVYDCSKTDCNKLKRDTSVRGECDIILALTSRTSQKKLYPQLSELCMACEEMTAYPEPRGGEMMIKRDFDTHRVELKKIRNVPTIKISDPGDVVKFVREMEDYDRERFKILYLDNKNRVIGVENISEGTINAALIHPREAVKGAVLANAAGVILVHNHPSGVPEPSREDNDIISRLFEGFGLLSIDVTDALIVGKEGYYSYKEAGRMPGKGKGGIERVMEQKDDKCSIALKAAMSTIKDYCEEEGETEVDIDGVKIKVTLDETVMQVREDPGLTDEQKVKAIQESALAQDYAKRLCTKLFVTVPGTDEYSKCVERVSRKFAETLMAIELDVRRIRKEQREKRISSEKMWD
jgi:DNA repair protein RadC